jgi:hypothetical protein
VERAALRLDDANEASLTFRDSHGNERMHVGVVQDNPRITLTYADGAGLIEIEADQGRNSAGIVISGAQGQVQALVGILGDGTPIMALLDSTGKPICVRPMIPETGAPAPNPQQFDWDALLRKCS